MKTLLLLLILPAALVVCAYKQAEYAHMRRVLHKNLCHPPHSTNASRIR